MEDQPMEPTNQQRAERCEAVLCNYGTDNVITVCLTDLLADARHWCDKNGESFADHDRMAHDHYLAEIADEMEQRKQ
jgi:hypothetical protein